MSKKLENIYIFKIVWDQIRHDQELQLKNMAVTKYMERGVSAPDAWEYAIDCMINRLEHEEQERLKVEKSADVSKQDED